MKRLISILEIENDIVTQLGNVSGVDAIFRETLSDKFDADRVDNPVLLIQNGGYTVPKRDGAGIHSSQLMTSIWIVSIVCKKDEYMTKGSVVMMEMLNTLKNFKAEGWRHRLNIVNDVKELARPVMSDRVALYPFFFGVDVVI